MCAAIDEHFPAGASYYRPAGGLFLWVTLPAGLDAVALLPEAAAHQVAYVPGQPFFVDGRGQHHAPVVCQRAARDDPRGCGAWRVLKAHPDGADA